jgi:hypothetical protein
MRGFQPIGAKLLYAPIIWNTAMGKKLPWENLQDITFGPFPSITCVNSIIYRESVHPDRTWPFCHYRRLA